jgi:hypothetical protein
MAANSFWILELVAFKICPFNIRSRANTTRGLDFEHMIKREYTREV